MPRCDGSMSRVMPASQPGIKRRPGCQPKVDVASTFGIRSIFSASRACKNRTTCLAFSLVIVQPKSARVVMLWLLNIVDRGKVAVCHLPSRLKATSIFSSPVSRLCRRCVKITGVLHTTTGVYCFSSIRLMPLSE